jgi:Tfp pilus assembly protein PilF
MNDWQGEIEEERTAIQQSPKLAIAHFQLATALEHEGDSSAALDEYRRAAELDPHDANYQANYQRLARASDNQ